MRKITITANTDTIVTPAYRRDAERLKHLERWSMMRYYKAWAQRNIKRAEVYFAAADRCARLQRMMQHMVG